MSVYKRGKWDKEIVSEKSIGRGLSTGRLRLMWEFLTPDIDYLVYEAFPIRRFVVYPNRFLMW